MWASNSQTYLQIERQADRYDQCDQNGWFLKVLGDKFCSKSRPNDGPLFGHFWKTSFFCKNCRCYCLGNFWKHLGYFLLQHLVTLVTTKITAFSVSQFTTTFATSTSRGPTSTWALTSTSGTESSGFRCQVSLGLFKVEMSNRGRKWPWEQLWKTFCCNRLIVSPDSAKFYGFSGKISCKSSPNIWQLFLAILKKKLFT